MNNKLKPALIGGVLLGILSVIPFVNFVNVCCCLWAILGGALASYLYIKNSPTPATAADGAVLGALAGLVGGLLYLVIGIPVHLMMGPVMNNMLLGLMQSMDPRQAEMFRAQLEASASVGSAIVQGFISAVFLFVFSIVGGLIAIPIFEKRKSNPLPPPPPDPGNPGAYAA